VGSNERARNVEPDECIWNISVSANFAPTEMRAIENIDTPRRMAAVPPTAAEAI
jgi:hypothetical protein